MAIRITTADAFTAAPFAGNPAAVCLLPAPREDAWLQAVAREMNLAETAFLLRCGDEFGLRWFTPAVEVDLCGHATLASAHVLWEEGHLDRAAEARFHTRSGLLAARHDGDWITLDFPATPPAPCESPPDLGRALGAPLRLALKTPFDYLVELESEAAVTSLAPDLGALARLGGRGVIVTSRAARPGFDFVPGSSLRRPASPRTLSPARPIARWARSGASGSARPRWSATRRRRGAAWCE